MYEYTYSGVKRKLSDFISGVLPELNFSTMQKLFRKGEIRVNGNKVRNDQVIFGGDTVRIYYNFDFAPYKAYEDDNIVIYYKPSKISSTGENSFSEKVTAFINKEYIICHRLDTNTTGLLLFAKNPESEIAVREAFRKHQILKYYFALVYGKFPDKKTFEGYLTKDKDKGIVKICDKNTKGALKVITKTELVKTVGELSFIEIELSNGKTHQIRAHLSHGGYPIVGDGKYGIQDINKAYKRHNQSLMAYKICFNITSGHLSYLNNKTVSLEKTKFAEQFFKI